MQQQERHFMFGYGSLINSISRSVTGDTGKAWPVKVNGFSRHWSKITSAYGMSSLVVLPSEQASCNGVLVEVDPAEFASFDQREIGYQRQLVAIENVSFYGEGDLGSNAKIWLYVAKSIVPPCNEYPIVLSYMDVVLSGCLEYGSEFCQDFVDLTTGWQCNTINDRPTPRYPRFQSDLKTIELDAFIKLKTPLCDQELARGYII